MSKRAKIKEIKKIVGSGDINGLFEEMMGIKDAEPEIIRKKFVKLRNLVRHVYKVLIQFSQFSLFQKDFPETKESMGLIGKFANDMVEDIYFEDVNQEEDEEKYIDVKKEEINALYKKLKDNSYIKKLIVLCGRLRQYKLYIDDKNNLKDNFVGQEPGLSLLIFDFSTLDLKQLWAHNNINTIIKKYVLNMLHVLWKDTMDIYKIITSPDVDIVKFTKLLIDSLSQLRKQPGLERCNNAFNRIEKSVELLNDKFDIYYRESIISSNPNMIIESFIVDVSNQGGADARLTREFRQIINHMHKVSQNNGKNKDPNVQKLFKMLNQNFEMMEGKDEIKTPPDIVTDETPENNISKLNIELKKKQETKEVVIYTQKKESKHVANKKNKKKKK